jgi:hypothetical protein
MYMPGRLRTGSKPSKAVMSLALYCVPAVLIAMLDPGAENYPASPPRVTPPVPEAYSTTAARRNPSG